MRSIDGELAVPRAAQGADGRAAAAQRDGGRAARIAHRPKALVRLGAVVHLGRVVPLGQRRADAAPRRQRARHDRVDPPRRCRAGS
jgi:hypothetical protein